MRYVYVVEAENGLVKIGFASSPKERLRALQTGSPLKLRLRRFLKIPDAPVAERGLHERFRKHRVHGEWFSISAREAAAAVDELAGVGSRASVPHYKLLTCWRCGHRATALVPAEVTVPKFRCSKCSSNYVRWRR